MFCLVATNHNMETEVVLLSLSAAPVSPWDVSPEQVSLTDCVFVCGSDASERALVDPVAPDVAHQLLQHLLPVAARVLHTCNSSHISNGTLWKLSLTRVYSSCLLSNVLFLKPRCVTVIGHNDDVDAAVQAELLEAVHQLTHDLVHAPDGVDQLEAAGETNTIPHTFLRFNKDTKQRI